MEEKGFYWAVWVVVSFICCQHHDMIKRPRPLFPGHLVVATQPLDRKGKVRDGEQLLLTLFEWPFTGFNTFGFGRGLISHTACSRAGSLARKGLCISEPLLSQANAHFL